VGFEAFFFLLLPKERKYQFITTTKRHKLRHNPSIQLPMEDDDVKKHQKKERKK
jgi:hypothetical protein